jgi:hypothetical protein
VGDAVADQQSQMRHSYAGFANLISSAARRENATWPLFRIPDFELHAGEIRLQSQTEILACTNLIDPQDEAEYLNFVTENYVDSLNEGHMTLYGNLDRLVPFGYTPNFTTVGPDGFKPDTISQPYRSPFWQLSPRTHNRYVFIHCISNLIRLTFDTLFRSSRIFFTKLSVIVIL